MKFTVKRDALLEPLQLVTGVVERRQTMPVLANVLFVLVDNRLTITGTDLEVEIVAHLMTDATDQPGEITIPARKLVDICRSLPEGSLIQFNVNEDQRLVLKSRRSRFVLSTLPANDFPAIETIVVDTEFTCSQSLIKNLIDFTSFAMAQQDVRFYLNGILWEVEDNRLSCVATDGHRLALRTCELDTQSPGKLQAIVPRKGVMEFSRFLKELEDKVDISLGNRHVRMQTENYTITSKLVDGKFPDYHGVIPRNGKNIMTGDRNELKQAFSRVSILSNEKYRGVRLILSDGLLTIVANNPEQEEAEEQVIVDYSGDPIEMGFNVSYLIDVANVLKTDQLKMTLSDSNSSALLEELKNVEGSKNIEGSKNGDSLYVIMPMRL